MKGKANRNLKVTINNLEYNSERDYDKIIVLKDLKNNSTHVQFFTFLFVFKTLTKPNSKKLHNNIVTTQLHLLMMSYRIGRLRQRYASCTSNTKH